VNRRERNLPARQRDPDLVGAEAAMHRAGRRARERAEQLVGSGAKARLMAQLDGLCRSLRWFWSFLRGR